MLFIHEIRIFDADDSLIFSRTEQDGGMVSVKDAINQLSHLMY